MFNLILFVCRTTIFTKSVACKEQLQFINLTNSHHHDARTEQRKLIVCYVPKWQYWSVIQEEQKDYFNRTIDPDICTHIIYAYGKVDAKGNIDGNDNQDLWALDPQYGLGWF